MSVTYANPTWTDGDWSKPKPEGLPLHSTPLPWTSNEYVFTQKFKVHRSAFAVLPLNSKHPDYSDFVLVEEGPRTDIGGGMVEWERTYAAVPDAGDEYETYPFNLIGFANNIIAGPNFEEGRARQIRRVNSRVHNEFFLAGNTYSPINGGYGTGTSDGNATSSGPGTVAAPYDVSGSIPRVNEFYYCLQLLYLSVWYGGIEFPTDFIGQQNTFPLIVDYKKMCSDARLNGWNATISVQLLQRLGDEQYVIIPETSTLGGQLVPEPSQLTRWKGNIWLRRTRYVLAE